VALDVADAVPERTLIPELVLVPDPELVERVLKICVNSDVTVLKSVYVKESIPVDDPVGNIDTVPLVASFAVVPVIDTTDLGLVP
jgi:hypothetical protein